MNKDDGDERVDGWMGWQFVRETFPDRFSEAISTFVFMCPRKVEAAEKGSHLMDHCKARVLFCISLFLSVYIRGKEAPKWLEFPTLKVKNPTLLRFAERGKCIIKTPDFFLSAKQILSAVDQAVI